VRRTAPLIVGGGPAGAAAAITLARAGICPLLLERTRGPHGTVCGGFLGWDALARLEALGLDPWAHGARPIGRVRIVTASRAIEAALPGRAAGLSRAVLDEALLVRAEAAGAEVRRGATVRAVSDDGVQLADGKAIAADVLFVATGKHELRGNGRRTGRTGHVGLSFAVAGEAALDGVIELHPFRGGYAGLLNQEDGQANLCLSVAAERFQGAGGTAAGLAAAIRAEAPALAERLEQAGRSGAAIAGVPYGWRRTESGPAFRIGDQTAVIASVVGDGVAIALASGMAAGRSHLAGEPAARFQRRFAARVRRPLAVAEACRAVAERPGAAQLLMPLAARAGLIGRLAAWSRVG
jgi:menaquinone-9 beta-reductase